MAPLVRTSSAIAPFRAAIGAGLVALALAVYLPVLGFDFLNYDDPGYVTANARVLEGITAGNVAWSLSAFQNGNWHPATLLSHMLDVSLFGLDPRGHHGTNLLLHAANVLLLFLLLSRATGRAGPSAFVAAAFAVHPLHVQTVAWIAERKSVLSTFFWLLALLAWASFRRDGGGRSYAAALGFAALAAAAKPMAVTLPFTLVLLDLWPLGVTPGGRPLRTARLLAPFFLISLACGIATLAAQRSANALQSFEAYPVAVRFAAVPVGYAWYLAKAFWPSGLAVFYPHPHATASAGLAVACGVALAVGTALAARFGRARPFVLAGWLWYAITLAPVSGIVQVGSQAYADRYAYVPLLGIFALVAWGVAEAPPRFRIARIVAAVAAVAALALACRGTLAPWRDSEALFRRAVQVVPDGSVARNNLGMALVDRGRVAEAVAEFREAVRYAPWDLRARSNLGSALTVVGRPAEALTVFDEALLAAPDDPSLRFNRARALAAAGRPREAIAELGGLLRAAPGYAKAPLLLGDLLLEARRPDEAVPALERAVALAPREARAHRSLAIALAASGRREEALARVEEALRLDPQHDRARELGAMLRRDLGRP